MTFGSVRPDDLVLPDQFDGPTAVQQRLSAAELTIVPHQDTGSERRVELVTREGEEIDASAGHVNATVGGELRGVNEQHGAVGMSERGQLREGPDLAGDVRGAGGGNEIDRGPGGP